MRQVGGTFFGEVQKVLARAMHEAGSTDREIADAIPTSVNNITWWRREEGLPDNAAPPPKAYTPPVERPTATRTQRPTPPDRTGQLVGADAPPAGLSAAQALANHYGQIDPTNDAAIEIGKHMDATVHVDLTELLTTRLLVQGNSGSGKSHLLRKLLEESAGLVQQIIIDPEGDFASFADAFGHTVVIARDHKVGRLATIATKAREHRGSIVVSLEGFEIDDQMAYATAFLDALFEAPPQHWHPALVVVDEAHLFAPSMDNGEDKETRQGSRSAMANLMCRGRKRGLAGIIATQRLAKLHKSVASEASNFLVGRTFLDIDINRAADLVGLTSQQREEIRNLKRGEFLGLGPAIAKRALKVTIGPVTTVGRATIAPGLTPLPTTSAADMAAMLLADEEEQTDSAVVPFRKVGQ